MKCRLDLTRSREGASPCVLQWTANVQSRGPSITMRPPIPTALLDQHRTLTRRYFLRLAAAGVAGAAAMACAAAPDGQSDAAMQAAQRLDYLTRDADFGTVERGDPLPYALPE